MPEPTLKELIQRRDHVGNDLDRVLDERDQVRTHKHVVKDRDPKTEQREAFLEEREKKLRGEERDLTKRIKALRERDEKLIKKIARKRREKKEARKIQFSPGYPHWGGSEDIIEREVLPVAAGRFAVTSRKRPSNHPLSVSNPGSDHNEANTTASAVDFGTYQGAGLAQDIARALGISGYQTHTYTGYYIERGGRTFRVQILWGVPGHDNHVHAGLRAV